MSFVQLRSEKLDGARLSYSSVPQNVSGLQLRSEVSVCRTLVYCPLVQLVSGKHTLSEVFVGVADSYSSVLQTDT